MLHAVDDPEVPTRSGKLKEVNKFDAHYFNIPDKEAELTDPMCRMLLEATHEALVDAGVRPAELRGKNVGVITAFCYSESESDRCYHTRENDHGYAVVGCGRSFFSNRISWWLGIHGQSISVDSACSSSSNALEQGYRMIRDGVCESVIIGAANLLLVPQLTLQFARLGVLSHAGDCRPFDFNANGYVRSEALSVMYLQKAKDSKRVYCTFVHGKTNCDGNKPEGITYPSQEMQQKVMEECYEECGVDPATLDFLEAHGTGTRAGDPVELMGLDKVFCTNRKSPLLIGSTRSNMGHPEPVSGMCSVSKVIISMETGLIAPNLNYCTPREEVGGLIEGRMKVVTEPTPWNGGLVGVSSFGFGGANTHLLLRSNLKVKDNGGQPKDTIPRLVVVSGRTAEAVNTILDDIESRPVDVEFVRLLHDVFNDSIPGHTHRGFSLLLPGNRRKRHIKAYSEKKRPLWFVFSGLGSQWPGMGKSLLKIPAFSAAIEKCDKALKSKGLDVIELITSEDSHIFSNIINSFVAVAAVQIGLIDILSAAGIIPDGIIGHSVGDVACAYADGLISAEQVILVAYYRGAVIAESKPVPGAMATVGLGSEQLRTLCPPGVEVVCLNGPNSSTISGPAELVKKFVNNLQSNKIPVQVIQCSGVALHSQGVAKAGPKLLQILQKVIPSCKPRSGKWVNASQLEAQQKPVELLAGSLLRPVLFQEASQHIPTNALTLEVTARSTLQGFDAAICQNGTDSVETLLYTLGTLYEAGVEMDLAKLYPPVSYPVSRGTPMISPLIKWDHATNWYILNMMVDDFKGSSERSVVINIKQEGDKFYAGHVIDGRNLFPAAGYLVLVWETLAAKFSKFYGSIDVVFEDIRFNRATQISKDVLERLVVTVQRGSGLFEVQHSGTAIVTGRIRVALDVSTEMFTLDPPVMTQGEDIVQLTEKDIYKELRLRGYNYSGLFRGLVSADNTGLCGQVRWQNNWVTFLDNLLQIKILGCDSRGLYVPTAIDKLTINVYKHYEKINYTMEDTVFPVQVDNDLNVIQSSGVEIRGLRASQISRRKPMSDPVLERYQFVPHCAPSPQPLSLHQVLRLCVHVVLENQPSIKVRAVELLEEGCNSPQVDLLSPELVNILGDLPLIQPNITILANQNDTRVTEPPSGVEVQYQKLDSETKTCLLVIASNVAGRPEVLQSALGALAEGGCIIARESPKRDLSTDGLQVLMDQTVAGERILLLRKELDMTNQGQREIVIWITENNYEWLQTIQLALNAVKPHQRVVLVSQGEPFSGILGLFNCLRREPGGQVARCFFILDKDAPRFDPGLELYRSQLKKDLTVNVLQDGEWGSYRHLLLENALNAESTHTYNTTATPGDLSSLSWFEGILTSYGPNPRSDRELVHVYYSALNFRDVMIASGRLALDVMSANRISQDFIQGMEYSARRANGSRVMGMMTSSCIANVVDADPCLVWDIPDNWSLEDAATIPVVYGTVVYAFFVSGHIEKGESILIHSGSGGVGQAAINVALHYGLTVYTTVGTQEKREFIKKQFPQITDNHIGNSRDTSFEEMIMRETGGRGVDLVLNSLTEEKLLASVRCLAQDGRFLEIGKYDLINNSKLGMERFRKGISFYGVMLDKLFTADSNTKTVLQKALTKAMKDGAVKPLTRTIFALDEVEQAYRYMSAGKHIGKVLIKIRDEEHAKNVIPSLKTLPARPRVYCDPNLSYVILGGLGGFGLELADWLVLRGARKLLLSSRTGIRTGYQSSRVRIWREYGVTVSISTVDISTVEGVKTLLDKANSLGPVAGIFNLAVVLHDAMLENQTEEKFLESAKTKALATRHLDLLSRRMCPHLKHFVVFSSVSCGRGNAGQTNYGMSNSVMERVCEARVRDGLPGLAVQWGAIGEVGLVAQMQEDDRELVIGGTLQQRIGSCLEVLDVFLKQPHPIVASMVVAEKRAGGKAGNIVECVLNILAIRDAKKVSPTSSLASLGMDSMTAVEIKQTLEREYEVFLTPQEIRDLTVLRLQEIALSIAEKEDDFKDELRTPQLEGLHLFMSVIEEDYEHIPLELSLPSLGGQGLTFLVPGIDGRGTFLKPLASGLSGEVVALQLAHQNRGSSVQDMVNYLITHVSAHLHSGRPFRIVGYSFGGLLALELAKALEDSGHNGRLVLMDSSPDFLYNGAKAMLQDDEKLNKIWLLMHMLNLVEKLTANANDILILELHNLPSIEECVDHLMAKFPKMASFKKEYVRDVVNSMNMRMIAILKYKWTHTHRLNMPVLLLRPTAAAITIDEDYLLPKYCQTLETRPFITGNHVTMVEHPDTARYINEFLSEVPEKTSSAGEKVVKVVTTTPIPNGITRHE